MANGSNGSNLPLAINLVGPMVFQQSDNWLRVWLPDLSSTKYKHQAGIATGVNSISLDPGDYSLDGPTPSRGWPEPYCPIMGDQVSEIYELDGEPPNDGQEYIRIRLPRPLLMVGLFPEQCKMSYKKVEEPQYKYRATGMRLLYQATGTPVLTGVRSQNGSSVNWILPIDIAVGDLQVEVAINYHPYCHDTDPCHPEAQSDFRKMAEMVGVMDLDVKYQCERARTGPTHDCINPIAMM